MMTRAQRLAAAVELRKAAREVRRKLLVLLVETPSGEARDAMKKALEMGNAVLEDVEAFIREVSP